MNACAKCGYAPDADVSARWTLSINKRIQTANSYTVNSGASRWRYAKERGEWEMHVLVGMRAERVPMARPSSKRRVTITRRYAGRCKEIDRDNLAVKPLVDALVRRGVLYDDDSAHLELHVMQERGTENKTIVLVEELA